MLSEFEYPLEDALDCEMSLEGKPAQTPRKENLGYETYLAERVPLARHGAGAVAVHGGGPIVQSCVWG